MTPAKNLRCVAVIPARYSSTRLPGKALLPLDGKPLVQHVWEKTVACDAVDEVLVATDDARIAEAVAAFGGRAVMTSPGCPSGTDRVAEAVRGIDADVVVNVQGDEPRISPLTIKLAASALLDPDEPAHVSTACVRILRTDQWADPNCVKVVRDICGYALYFSRFPIPFIRAAGITLNGYTSRLACEWATVAPVFKHVGIYAYRKPFLERLVLLPESALEKAEKLEQLRILENGYRIRVVEVEEDSVGVDTEEDYQRLAGGAAAP